jgi:hypothetical protein
MTSPKVRVRKARRASRCPCGTWITIGALIVNRGHGWTCLQCGLAAIRQRQPQEQETRSS